MILNKHEHEFISTLCKMLVIDECARHGIYQIYELKNEKVVYTDATQLVYDELFDRYQTMYINVVKLPMLEEKKPEENLWEHKQMREFLNDLATFYGMSW